MTCDFEKFDLFEKIYKNLTDRYFDGGYDGFSISFNDFLEREKVGGALIKDVGTDVILWKIGCLMVLNDLPAICYDENVLGRLFVLRGMLEYAKIHK